MPCFEVGRKAKEIIGKLGKFFNNQKEVKDDRKQNHNEREQTLKEWCNKLPEFHRVNRELKKLQEIITQLDNMIYFGWKHTEESDRDLKEASNILKGKI